MRTTKGASLPLRDFIVILGAAALLALPAILGPLRLNDSFWIDWVWLDQFSTALRNGTAYPRWLPLSHGGLGSPVFYYYPPLSFYVGSIFALAGLSTYASIIATFFTGMILSGAAMYLWLRDLRARAPLAGALIYMAAPYHLYDFYQRGALAEFLAIAIVPMVMIGVRRLASGERLGFTIAALAYAALICTHLPLAVLASLFLFAPYGIAIARAQPPRLIPIVLALILGAAIAAIYLLPALMLEHYRDSQALWVFEYYQPSSWTVWDPNFRTLTAFLWAATLAGAVAISLAVLALWQRSWWTLLGLAAVLLALGVVPALWQLPVLRSIQFPFRLLPVAEFALATVCATWAGTRPKLLLSLAPIAVAGALVVTTPPALERLSLRDLQTVYPDVPENLPPGPRPYSWPSKWALSLGAAHKGPVVNGERTIEPLFYFPSWEVRCSGQLVPSFPDPQTKLLAYRGRDCSRAIVQTWPERLGSWISGSALLMLLCVGLGPRLLRKTPRR